MPGADDEDAWPVRKKGTARRLSRAVTILKTLHHFDRYDSWGLGYEALRQGDSFPRSKELTPRPRPEKKRSRSRRRRVSLREDDALRHVAETERRRAHMYVGDDKWADSNTTVWFPVAQHKRLWDYVMLFVLVYSIVVEPYRMAFDAPAHGRIFAFELLLSLIFIVDIGFTFNTAVRVPSRSKPLHVPPSLPLATARARIASPQRVDGSACLQRMPTNGAP
jgi:hypothetical protein